MGPRKPLQLDGTTGEGGGQLVRLACALAAVTSQPIRISNVRGNRGGSRGGGLKAQHVSAIQWLAKATEAEVNGLDVGSRTLEFRPSTPPTALKERRVEIVAGSSAASTLLIFQAVFPYLLFSGNETGDPIEVEIHGGTNVSWSLSYEYFDQVLLPTLQEKFGIVVERQLKARGWSIGPAGKGCIWIKFRPLRPGIKLEPLSPWDRPVTAKDFHLKQIDVSMLVPGALRAPLAQALAHDLDELFPNVDINFAVMEESSHDARMYTLLVARSETGLRWGRDYLYDRAWRKKTPEKLSSEISRKVCKDLFEEITLRGVVDEHLQDQLIVFQALAEGRTSFPRGAGPNAPFEEADGGDELGVAMENLGLEERRIRRDKTHEPFGEGSMHTTTARWVASELLPTAQWFDKGTICDGAGVFISS
ncbi:RNA 3'-terminal phosphate cyclase domain-containing protein [Biscogniauxia marginata]|nr:RNA 3'-terminal phosphate cyclase domain-containing protein [Biscogniauxia marginata]